MSWWWIFVGIVVVLLLALLIVRRANAGVDPTQLLLDPELVTGVRVLAQQNQRLAAMKMLRDGTPGLGLASAKVMVDRMVTPRGGEVVATGTGSPDRVESVPPEVETQARSLKNAGNVIGAIKLVRSHLPDLRQAKDYVDNL